MGWYRVKKTLLTPSEKISATVTVPGDSPWFSGHFPGNPVLPAIAQISIVFDLIRQAIKKPIMLKTFHRVKFKRIILPDEEMDITAFQLEGTPMDFAFQILVGGEVACKGKMLINESNMFEI
jgi:3-hydroxymyristoyl/3-hydroxydecanoyl-(acyl carrier protein) dehydratase